MTRSPRPDHPNTLNQGELAHRLVKRFYGRTNKNNATKQIARHERRHTRLRRAREAAEDPCRRHAHHVGFSDNDPLPYTGIDMHHYMSDAKTHPHHLQSFIREPADDPSKKVWLIALCESCLQYSRILSQS